MENNPANKLSAEDIKFVELANAELARTDISDERRADLKEALGDIGEAARTDWLWDEPELRDHPENPRNRKPVAV